MVLSISKTYLYERAKNMAIKKQSTEVSESKEEDFSSSPPKQNSTQGRMNELINNAYNNGKIHGKKESLETVYNFLKEKSLNYFMNNQDDIAKIIRSLSNDVKKAIS